MNSCLYEGQVRHRRRKPKPHSFNFDLYMLCLDLDELDDVFRGKWLWSTRRPALARFKADDHLKAYDTSLPLRDRVLAVLRQGNMTESLGSVRLLTQFRYLGFEMNPVSFFYCYDKFDGDLIAVIAEVNNTPWGEQHVYLIENPSHGERNSKTILADRIDKVFHVSPFMSLDMFYRMIFTRPGEEIGVKIENFESGQGEAVLERPERIFHVAMSLQTQTNHKLESKSRPDLVPADKF